MPTGRIDEARPGVGRRGLRLAAPGPDGGARRRAACSGEADRIAPALAARRGATPRRRTARVAGALVLGLASAAACVQDELLPPASLLGPSELALSVQLTADPDVLPLDGVARSVVSVRARDERARPVAGLSMTVETYSRLGRHDYGTLSTPSVTTGGDGRAWFSYTAPDGSEPPGAQAPGAAVTIRVTPQAADHASALPRSVVIRLVPPGRVFPPFAVAAGFTYEPSPPSARDTTLFRARYCDAGGGRPPTCVDDPRRLATRFAWRFGDGTQAAGPTAAHVFDLPGNYAVTLTVGDDFQRSASETRAVTVNPGAVPTPAFDVSPASPAAGESVVLDAGRTTSRRPVVAYDWRLGDGAAAEGLVVTHRYRAPGAYTVTLTATDDRGGAATARGRVTVVDRDEAAESGVRFASSRSPSSAR